MPNVFGFIISNLIMQNMDINKLIDMISKMDKDELEKNIAKAQKILNNTDFKDKM